MIGGEEEVREVGVGEGGAEVGELVGEEEGIWLLRLSREEPLPLGGVEWPSDPFQSFHHCRQRGKTKTRGWEGLEKLEEKVGKPESARNRHRSEDTALSET